MNDESRDPRYRNRGLLEARTRRDGGRRNARPESGQSLLEVALLTTLLLPLLIGVIEVGRYAYIAILVGNAARAGAAYGSESLANSVNTAGIQTAADNDFQNNGQNVSSLTVTSSASCGCDNSGTTTSEVCSTSSNPNAGTCTAGHWVVMVSVTASGTFTPLFKYPGISKQISLSSTCQMRVAQD
jgi:Flp pilus assembly protein TadG